MLDYDIIETPEGVELERPLAGIGTRFLAGFIDSLLLVLAFLILIFFPMLLLSMMDDNLELFFEGAVGGLIIVIVMILLFLLYWGYFVFFEMRTNGQSPGKKQMKVRVVQLEGGGIDFKSIAIRNLLRVVDGIGFYLVAGVTMFFTGKVQRLGDLAAGTVVISEEIPNYSASYDKKKKILDNQELTSDSLEKTGLKPEEYHLLHNYWIRRSELTDEAKENLMQNLVRPILIRTGHASDGEPHTRLEEHLEEIITASMKSDTQELP